MTARRVWWGLTLVSLAAFLALTVLVTTHTTATLDARIRHDLNPSGTWGSSQLRAFRVTHWMRPTLLIPLFCVVSLSVALLRRSLRPPAYAALLVVATGTCEVGLKWLLPRIESDDGSSVAGSFPSGHVLSAVMVSGGFLLMVSSRTRWWHWLLASVLPAVMVVAVMVSVLHWASDVVGGVLLGVFLISSSALTPLRPARPVPERTGTRSAEVRPDRS